MNSTPRRHRRTHQRFGLGRIVTVAEPGPRVWTVKPMKPAPSSSQRCLRSRHRPSRRASSSGRIAYSTAAPAASLGHERERHLPATRVDRIPERGQRLRSVVVAGRAAPRLPARAAGTTFRTSSATRLEGPVHDRRRRHERTQRSSRRPAACLRRAWGRRAARQDRLQRRAARGAPLRLHRSSADERGRKRHPRSRYAVRQRGRRLQSPDAAGIEYGAPQRQTANSAGDLDESNADGGDQRQLTHPAAGSTHGVPAGAGDGPGPWSAPTASGSPTATASPAGARSGS